jgi:uncharacterized protein YjiS (DUF1127 family)
MNAYVSKEELALLPPDRISYPEHYAEASHRGRSWLEMLAGRVRSYFRMRATLQELNTLTDRELADIGLSRSNLAETVARYN